MGESIQELINQIPNIMTYFICGYLFSFVYHFVRGTKRTSEIKNILLKSVVISFFARSIFDALLTKLHYSTKPTWIYLTAICVLCIIAAYVFASVANCQWFNRLLALFGIRYTTNPSIWEDIIRQRQDCWIELSLKDQSDTTYYGLFRFAESDNPNPTIVISEYQIIQNDEIVEDYSDTDYVLVFNAKDVKIISIRYGSKVKYITRLMNLFHKTENDPNSVLLEDAESPKGCTNIKED